MSKKRNANGGSLPEIKNYYKGILPEIKIYSKSGSLPDIKNYSKPEIKKKYYARGDPLPKMTNYTKSQATEFVNCLISTIDCEEIVIERMIGYFNQCQFESGWQMVFKSFFYETFNVKPSLATEKAIGYCITAAARHFKVTWLTLNLNGLL